MTVDSAPLRSPHLCQVEPLSLKDVSDEVRAHKDLTIFAEEAVILLDVRASTPRTIVDALLAALVSARRLPATSASSAAVDVARAALVGDAPTSPHFALPGEAAYDHAIDQQVRHSATQHAPVLPVLMGDADVHAVTPKDDTLPAPTAAYSATPVATTSASSGDDDNGTLCQSATPTGPGHWHKNVQGPSYIIPFARVGALNESGERIVAIARLAHPCNLGAVSGGLTRFVAIVLAPSAEIKETKNAFELSRSLAALFSDIQFSEDARAAANAASFREAMRTFLDRTAPAVAVEREGRQRSKSTDDEGGEAGGRGWRKRRSKDKAVQIPESSPFARTGVFAGGLIADVKRRYNWKTYKSDWTDGITEGSSLLKYLSTIVWLYFAIIMPTIAFGALDDENTRLPGASSGQIGVIETIISQAFAGLTFATFAGQPLTIVMTTAPLTVFIEVLFSWSQSLSIKFLPFYAWTGLWTALILMVLVVTDSCSIMQYCGQFTEEIFATLIALLFIGEYVKPLIHIAEDNSTDEFLLAFILGTGTYFIANSLLSFRRSFLLKPIIRELLSDFGVPIAILVMSGIRQAFRSVDAELLAVPDEIGIVTTSGRPWLVPLFDIEVQFIFLAAVSGLLLATLFFLDQNISSILVNRPSNMLKKGPGYYLDLVVVSVIIVVQSLLGMPWTHAALPHSPLHARQLADLEPYSKDGVEVYRVVKARETRLTGFVTHLLIFASILVKDALGNIPLAVLYGFFLYMGFATLDGVELWRRVLLLFTQKERYPPTHYVRRVPIKRVHLYTGIQVFLLVVLWFFKSNFYLGDTVFNTGLLFPFIIALFIPVRLLILPRLFTPGQLHALGQEGDE